eukprot:CAMPEP_0196705884 /NCGR_PEP_ID=MMETSP1090-20130531/60816_1 /TAXON_ID=37098 /ORGANISM="Isochrysis sp, Strain CCMP1244" /LENGTH=116 /DNA_ID=CAMNT_0042045805 /DNA_START=51 /DNA_END=397 /DNA_ORIENTATION=-
MDTVTYLYDAGMAQAASQAPFQPAPKQKRLAEARARAQAEAAATAEANAKVAAANARREEAQRRAQAQERQKAAAAATAAREVADAVLRSAVEGGALEELRAALETHQEAASADVL